MQINHLELITIHQYKFKNNEGEGETNVTLIYREMICLQQFYNIFTTNLKWQIVTGCYCWVKKVISVLNSNLNQ